MYTLFESLSLIPTTQVYLFSRIIRIIHINKLLLNYQEKQFILLVLINCC